MTTRNCNEPMKAVGKKVLKSKPSDYLRLVKSGETVLDTDRDEVIAELRPSSRQQVGEKSLIIAKALTGVDRVVASRLLKVEEERAVLQLEQLRTELGNFLPDIKREMGNSFSRIDFIEISKEVCEITESLAPTSLLRSLDAIHLASFYRLRRVTPHIEMLTFDERIGALL